MTRYASPSVHICPGCDGFYFRQHLRSTNSYGVQDWSDGKPTMAWRQDPLVRCNACAALFWLDDIEAVGTMPEQPQPIGRLERAWLRWWGDPDGLLQREQAWTAVHASWGRALTIGRVNVDDVVYVLGRSRNVERHLVLWLRKHIWWCLNDRYRSRSDGSPYPGVPVWPIALERTNMEVILGMLQDGEGHPASMIEQGELLRQLGRFDEAVAILKAVPADGHSEVRAVRIERLARNGDAQVRLLSQPSW